MSVVHIRLPGTDNGTCCKSRGAGTPVTVVVPAQATCKACKARLRRFPQLAAQILYVRNLVIPGTT